ncbi:MAG: hypothetical protein M1823_005674 [Watsoniomyces obsoletus]|nr:MAG: hypothetical protein M1823_005674 [Watsoniomyces obsoletus]
MEEVWSRRMVCSDGLEMLSMLLRQHRSCALQGRILSVRQDATHLHYRAGYSVPTLAPLTPPASNTSTPDVGEKEVKEDDTTELVQRYFNLVPNLTRLYQQWSKADANFKKRAPKFTGVRMLGQDPWEALVGFICSSNNNIVRISQMVRKTLQQIIREKNEWQLIRVSYQVEKLCLHYGPLIGYIGDRPYHDMPPPIALVDAQVESQLRQLGFGYRAKYLHQTAMTIVDARPPGWLDSLQNKGHLGHASEDAEGDELPLGGREGYRRAHEEIMALPGVGPKVADCVCLMGLGWAEAVPVDTHVWQIAQRDYKFGRGKHRTLTKTTYDAIGDHFRSLWGEGAGWAHSVLFSADLRAFADRVSSTVVKKEEVAVRSEDVKTEDVKTKTVATTASVSDVPKRSRKRKMETTITTTTTNVKVEFEDSPPVRRSKRQRTR